MLPRAARGVRHPEDIFTEYAYFSSYSKTWVEHAKAYVEMIAARLGSGAPTAWSRSPATTATCSSTFVAPGIPVLGIEPAANVADAARREGHPDAGRVLRRELARSSRAEGRQADLIVGNNVLAQVPDLNDFVAGLQHPAEARRASSRSSSRTCMRLIEREPVRHDLPRALLLFLACSVAERIFAAHGLTLFDVEELPTHGGSLRIYARHAAGPLAAGPADRGRCSSASERRGVLRASDATRAFDRAVAETKRRLLRVPDPRPSDEGKTIVGYGAPGKGNTLLNYCGIRTDFLDYTVDRNPYKQGKFLPGTHIPIFPPEKLAETRPDYVLILPWNLKDEIIGQMSTVAKLGRAVRRSDSPGGSDRMIFRPLEVSGAFLIEPEPIRTSAASSRGSGAGANSKSTAFSRASPSAACRSTRRRGPCGACTTRSRRMRRSSSYVARGARSTTSFSICGPLRRPSGSTLPVTLTAGNRRMLYVPEGFAHGFVTLEDATEVFYQMSEFYAPERARGVRWNDPSFGIPWPRGRRS